MSVREDIVHKLAVVRIADRVAAGHMEVARWRMAAEGKARHQPQARSTTLSLGSSLGKGVKKEDEFESWWLLSGGWWIVWGEQKRLEVREQFLEEWGASSNLVRARASSRRDPAIAANTYRYCLGVKRTALVGEVFIKVWMEKQLEKKTGT
jgi:hypothetical protein